MFAHRLGLSLDRLLAFSAVAEIDREAMERYLRAPERVVDRLHEQISQVADAFEGLWGNCGRVISRFS